jgi:hypothetical protein
MTTYMLSLIDTEAWYDANAEEFAAEMKLHEDFAAAVAAAGCQITGGAVLQPQATATTVHRGDGQISITDGPFIEAKEVIGGYYLIEAPDLDAAVKLAQICPSAHVEVRPLMVLPGAESPS